MKKANATIERKLKRADKLMKTEAFTEATVAYSQIVADNPKHPEARWNLAVAHAHLGHNAQAIEAFRALIDVLPDVAATHAALAASLETFRIDRYEPGVALRPATDLRAPVNAYMDALNAVEVLRNCHTALVELFTTEERRFEAAVAQTAATRFAADLPDAMRNLGATMARPGNLNEALAMHRRVVAEVPDQWNMTEEDYLKSDLTFKDDEIVTPDGLEVMMEWERPIMERSAEIVCHNQGDVLNVGFGMAIIDSAIQRCGVTSHTIIEAHPLVQRRARDWARDKKAVTIIPSTWQNALKSLKPFDGIYFDTLIPPMVPFLRHAPSILKKNGVFSFFQYMLALQNITTMIRDDLEFGIEHLEFDDIPDNTYYRVTDKNANGRYVAPLYLFRKV